MWSTLDDSLVEHPYFIIFGCFFLIEDVQEITFWENYKAINTAFQEENFLKIMLFPLRKDL